MSQTSPSLPADRRIRALPAIEVALILAVFYLHAGWPAPDVNEAHYLDKAKHYWDSSWLPNDFFCSTADAHLVFYWTFGWLTRWLSLAGAAWIGRIAAWTLLAAGWRRLSVVFAPGPFFSVLSAALLVVLADRFNLAGEWIVGGLEAKGVAYALIFFALADMVRGRWTRMWLLLGGAGAFHVVVGGWAAIAAAFVWLAAGKDRPPLGRTLIAWAGATALAMPGLAPALALTWGADSATVAAANSVYVFERLAHHLVFSAFPVEARIRFALLVALWALLDRLAPRDIAARRMGRFVAASLALVAIGVAIDYGLQAHERLAAALLRYYWFRLADAMLPAGTALAAISYLRQAQRERSGWGAIWLLALLLAAGAHLAEVVSIRLTYPCPRSDYGLDDPEAWWEICDWVRDNSPPDAVFMVPRLASTFGWRTDRAAVVCNKDIPQDARGVVAWRRRMRDLYWRPAEAGEPAGWRGSLASLGRERLIALGAEYGAGYVLTTAKPRLPLMRVSPPDRYYAVYKLPPPAASAARP